MVAEWYWRSLRSKVLYEYGVDIEELLDPSQVEFDGSSRTPSRFMSVRIRDGPHLAALREDGSLAISVEFARILLRSPQFQESCVVVDGDSVEFVRRGMSVMSGHVMRIGSNVVPGLDVCVLSPDGEPIAVGSCVLPRRLSGARSGPLVKVRAHERASSDAAPQRRAGAGSR
ncbi:MAG: PUA domain-containing protein [Conexivisphaera sp.]